MMSAEECRDLLRRHACCVVVPTYNNAGTIAGVVASVREYCDAVYVANDGSTDGTAEILSGIEGIRVLEYADGKNRGKGYAIKNAFVAARADGFRNMITFDADGQHYAEDIATLGAKMEEMPGALIVGARDLAANGMPAGNTFANKFSNFWYRIETLERLEDTQSGLRLYPIDKLDGVSFVTDRYEFEVEVLVRAVWRGIEVVNVPIRVIYPEDRVSHFRPFNDFARISLVNTGLVFGALFYYYPKKLIKWLMGAGFKAESNGRLAAAVGLGVMIGMLPIYGFQLVVGIALAHLLKLNKIVVGAFTNVSIPPMIPVIIMADLWVGENILGISDVGAGVVRMVVGGIVVAVAGGVLMGLLTWGVLALVRR